ncbi:MAG: dolichyl-phosphate beta-glucosyltransferase [Candidatus Hydrothermarchaeales archaeon]
MYSVARPKPELSVVIPAYNEEERIESVLRNYADFYRSYEIIVVCNGCSDTTPEIVAKRSKKDPRIKSLNFDEKLGKGGAVIEGFKAAKGELIGFLDADESVVPEDYLKIIDAVKSLGFDGAIGSRGVEGAEIISDRSFARQAASKIFNMLVRRITGLEFSDTQCGAKVFKRKPLGKVRDAIFSVGYEFDVELLLRLKRRGYKIVEVPVKWTHSGNSKFSLIYAPAMFFGLLLLRLRK